jgi:toxin YoeB
MGKYIIVVEKTAQKELQALEKSGDKASIKRVEIIFEELAEHPQTGIGKPEQLRFKLSGYWSR